MIGMNAKLALSLSSRPNHAHKHMWLSLILLTSVCISGPSIAASLDCSELTGDAGVYVKKGHNWSKLEQSSLTLGHNQFAFKPKGSTNKTDRDGVLVVKQSENYAISGHNAEGLRSRKYIEDRYPNTSVKLLRKGKSTSPNKCKPAFTLPFPITVGLGDYVDYHRKNKDNQKLKNFHSEYAADRENEVICQRTDDDTPVPNNASASRSNREQFLFDEGARKPYDRVARIKEFSFIGSAFAAEAAPRLLVHTIYYDLGKSAINACPQFNLTIKNKQGVLQVSDLEGKDDFGAHFRKRYNWIIK